jgi:HSP20 family protein
MVWLPLTGFETTLQPFREFTRLQREINSLFSERASGRNDFPGINIWSNDEEAVVAAEVPGVEPGEIAVSISGNALTIEGERKPEVLTEKEVYHRRERGYGRFVRTVQLPFEVESDKIEARAQHGVLMIRLPRKESTKPRKISIRAS